MPFIANVDICPPQGWKEVDPLHLLIIAFITTRIQGTADFQQPNYIMNGCMMWIWVISGFMRTTKWIQLVFHLWKESSWVERTRDPCFFLCFNLFLPPGKKKKKKIPPKLSTVLSSSSQNCFPKIPSRWFSNLESCKVNFNKLLSFLSTFQCLLKNKYKVNFNALCSSSPIKRH